MELSTPINLFLVSACFMLIVTQALISFYYIVGDAQALAYSPGEQHDLHKMEGKLVHFNSDGEDFFFPIQKVSPRELSFCVDTFPSSLTVDGTMALDLLTGIKSEKSVEAKIQSINVAKHGRRPQIEFRVKFERELSSAFLDEMITEPARASRIRRTQHLSLAA